MGSQRGAGQSRASSARPHCLVARSWGGLGVPGKELAGMAWATWAVQAYRSSWSSSSTTSSLSHLNHPCHLWAFEDGPSAAHLHIIVGHEDGKTAQVVALAGGAVIQAAQLLAACGVPVPTTFIVFIPEGTDQLLLWSRLLLWAGGGGRRSWP